jgi:hypothetical protein
MVINRSCTGASAGSRSQTSETPMNSTRRSKRITTHINNVLLATTAAIRNRAAREAKLKLAFATDTHDPDLAAETPIQVALAFHNHIVALVPQRAKARGQTRSPREQASA